MNSSESSTCKRREKLLRTFLDLPSFLCHLPQCEQRVRSVCWPCAAAHDAHRSAPVSAPVWPESVQSHCAPFPCNAKVDDKLEIDFESLNPPVDGAQWGGVPHGGLAQLQACRVRGHIAILTGAAEQNVAKVMERAALAEAVEEAVAHVGGVAHAELQQRARLLPLLHEPHAWQGAQKDL